LRLSRPAQGVPRTGSRSQGSWPGCSGTKTAETKDGQAEALDKLVIRYPAADMQPVSAKTAATLDKLAALLKASKKS
jgi:hypothetical protein